MTKGAQLELRQVIQHADKRVRFCLICNYVARLASSLQDELVALRFDRLPKKDICAMLSTICAKEDVKRPLPHIRRAISAHGTDIRRLLTQVQLSVSGREATRLGGMPVQEESLEPIMAALTQTDPLRRAQRHRADYLQLQKVRGDRYTQFSRAW